MAAVYEASDLALGRIVALKLFRLDPTEDASAARQRDEVMVLAHLNHFALVTLYDAGTTLIGGIQRSFIVTEFVDGSDLRSRIREGPMHPGEVAGLGADLSEAMHYMHSQGVIHRDIKPANVLLATTDFPGRTARAKLADFGIARLFNAVHQTKEGTVIGTASYLSPEQAGGLAVGPASDVYSLGLVLLECLTAERSYSGTAAETALARLRRQPDIPDWLGADWRELLTGMTARLAEHRLSPADAAVRLLALVPGSRVGSGVGSGMGSGVVHTAAAVSGTVLPETRLPQAGLPETPPQSAALPETVIHGAVIHDAVLAETVLQDAVIPEPAPPTALLPDAGLPVSVLPETALPGTVLPETVLPETVLPETVLAETVLTETVPPKAQPPKPVPSKTVPSKTVRQDTMMPETLLLNDVAPPAAAPVRGAETPRQDTRKSTGARDATRPRRWPLVLSGILVVLVTIAAVLLVVPGTDPAPTPPAYPAVDGPLGEHLQQLQESVDP